uniref:Uncharacterized protein n=1 Tax=Streptomyces lividans TaxID=1916 RepID=A7TUT4_STRLI|nr:hypothetical protein SLG37 [Streptomyces lividans]
MAPHTRRRPGPRAPSGRGRGGGQQQGPAWQFSSANSVKGMGQQALNARTVRSSQPASTAATRAVRMVARSAIFASTSASLAAARSWSPATGSRGGAAGLQQLGDGLQREPEPLGRLDHRQRGHRLLAAQAVTAMLRSGSVSRPRRS